MTDIDKKREEIREKIADIVWKQVQTLLCGDSEALEEIDTRKFGYGKAAAKKITEYLHSQGVVIKSNFTVCDKLSREVPKAVKQKFSRCYVESLIDE